MLLSSIGSVSTHYLKEVSELIQDGSEGNLRCQLFRLSSLRRGLLLLLTTLSIIFWLLRLHLPSHHRSIGITAMLTVLHFTRAPGIRTQVLMLTPPVLPLTEPFPQPSSMSSTDAQPQFSSLIPGRSSSYSLLLLSFLPSHLPFHIFSDLLFLTFQSLGHECSF